MKLHQLDDMVRDALRESIAPNATEIRRLWTVSMRRAFADLKARDPDRDDFTVSELFHASALSRSAELTFDDR